MDHVVYVEAKANELESLLFGQKKMIIRGATGRKLHYGRVNEGDKLYFIRNNGEGLIQAVGRVSRVINSDKMDQAESQEFVSKYQSELQLTDQHYKRWAGKRYIVLIEVKSVQEVEPFAIDRSGYGNMDDWLPVEDINQVKK